MPFPPGTRLGPYEIRKVSPVPGLGELYDARDREQGRDVSLMVVRTDFAGDPDRLERFQREASAAALLDHPHILTVHNVGADAQAAYIISEPIEGRTLREVRAGGPIPPGAGAPFVPQIAEALTAAHERGVVHGNLTPDNILFTADGVKVIGFGLAAATGNTAATVSGDLAAFNAISEMLTGERAEAASGRGWAGVAAAVGVIAVATLLAVWMLGGNDGPASAEPEAVASDPVITTPPTADPPLSRLKPAPTTEGLKPNPTTEGISPVPTTPEQESAPSHLADLSAETAAKAEAPAKAEAARRRRPVPTSAASGPTRTTMPPPPPAGPSRLVWLDRTGAETGALSEPDDYGDLALSPDAMRVAVSIRGPGAGAADIWIIEAGSGARTRLTSDPADDIAPLWSPDGSRIVFASFRERSYDLYEKASDGAGVERLIVSAPGDQIASDWTPAKRFLLYQTDQPGLVRGGNLDLWARALPGGRPFAFLKTVHAASRPSSSPGARWVAFSLSGNGREDVYVAMFPHYDGRRRISPLGGSWPRWRGNQIFYVDTENRLMSVPVVAGEGDPAFGAPHPVSQLSLKAGRGYAYDVSADGQRILINTAPEDTDTLSRRAP